MAVDMINTLKVQINLTVIAMRIIDLQKNEFQPTV